MDTDNLYEKSPEAQRLLQQIPLRLRALAIILFFALAAGIWALACRLEFPESVQFNTYLLPEGQQDGTLVFKTVGPVSAASLEQPRQTTIQLAGQDGNSHTIAGIAVFHAPDSILITTAARIPPVFSNHQWPLSATVEVQVGTLPLWKKISGYGQHL
ncbi:MAG: hypothetical protein IPH12_12025 [Saprospirales bacterium]|jgi:hypothetical protein|nr:hypothetical protein [Saprospirales bacterium]MBK8921095.1 hypothetical protein [Saprospirales bacterium]